MMTRLPRLSLALLALGVGGCGGKDIAVVAGTWTPVARTITHQTCPIAAAELQALDVSLVISPVDALVAEVRRCADPADAGCAATPAETLGFEKDVIVWDAVRERPSATHDCVLQETFISMLVLDGDELVIFEDLELEVVDGLECDAVEAEMQAASASESPLRGCDVQVMSTWSRAG